MAEPIDSAVSLQDASEIVQEQYFAKYDEQYQSRFGSTTNKCFMPEPGVITGDGKTMQYEVGPADTVRMQIDPLGNIASGQNIDPGKVKIRWNETTAASHDFTQVSARTQFSTYTIENGGAGTVVDLAERIYASIQKDYDEKLAILRNCDRTGQLALVNGTPKKADHYLYASATASATNGAGMYASFDNGSIATIRPNARYDFINPTTGAVLAGNIRCTDIPSFSELAARFEFVSAGAGVLPNNVSTGNLASVTDNAIVVFSGMYNASLWSLGAALATPVNSTAYIAGINRMSAGYGWAIPQRMRDGVASAKVTKSMFNSAAIAMGFLGEDPQTGIVFQADPTLHQSMRDELGEESFIQIPVSDDRSKRFMNFGSVGLNYQHSTFGMVKIVSDPLAPSNRISLIANGTWKTLSYAWKGLKPISEGGSHWYRMSQGTPNTGKGLIYAADWVGNIADWCNRPWQNGVILNLTA